MRTARARTRRTAALLAPLVLAVGARAAQAQAIALVGSDRVRLELPAGVLVEDYENAGYRLRVERGMATVEVDLAPLRSSQPFILPPAAVSHEPVAVLARAVAAGAATRYEAVTRVLQWVARNVAYDLDRDAAQDPAAVLARRSGYCTGMARLSVALLRALDVPAREVPGFLVAPAGAGAGPAARAGFHRWIEVRYDDVGWVFSDPLVALHYVPATYVRVASEALLPAA
ncbi:MAG TPA: transglutaminase-like domain-containing protein, partial [Thermoanaerobaculia bacterium]|nr:transglutaminase-like domain-containing protein [Thermoanaerobaculia bacterium]